MSSVRHPLWPDIPLFEVDQQGWAYRPIQKLPETSWKELKTAPFDPKIHKIPTDLIK